MSDPICVQAFAPNDDSHDSLTTEVDLDSTTKFPGWMLAIVCVPRSHFITASTHQTTCSLTWAMFTVFLLGLIAYRVYRTFRRQVRARRADDEGGGLAYILVRDSVLYGCL